mmetsp:Transcript_11884/g.21966  ORF Transcript_11884/g.21966 Transcript_11884/m.21966 type:complete len:162 (-) Transcript_11884:402-887(-)|eukprot:CAMPEP_0201889716 /NCGR_PEP_ID=MMETSP0902-20130614/30664_1 /ASSEMBLY_ACC=CAM_ASM_000551 /TAXON_ID=420261 /ORGANISM="Thalassiosira antarctica, Strain CCMP982" /LENGTH=161 /DNA_ID=CAMNT_0048420379 /DNA_START=88 /DNA_END=573 /DNA_ORIENTATION=-
MISLLKLIAFTVAAQFVVAGAFVSNGSHSTAYRSVQVQGVGPVVSSSPSTTRLYMAVASPTPVKKKEKKVTNESDNETEKDNDRGWLVRLYNDPMNKREFVAKCLMEICGLDDGMSFTIMMKAHQAGIAVIGNYPREQAEMYKMGLSGEGLMVDMVPADDD